MIMSILDENILEEKKENYFFNCIFDLSSCRFTQMSCVNLQEDKPKVQ